MTTIKHRSRTPAARRALNRAIGNCAAHNPGKDIDMSQVEAVEDAILQYYRTDVRIKVARAYLHDPPWIRTGRVGMTTGHRPALLLMHRSGDLGSWDVLGTHDHLVAVWDGRRYVEVDR